MDYDPETSLVKTLAVPDYEQNLDEDPVPNLLEEMNRFRSKIPIACQQLFDRIKESYKENYIDFPILDKDVAAEDIQAKYSINLYFKERIIGELSIPHFEFDDDLNEMFCRNWGPKIYNSMKAGALEGQKVIDEYRAQEDFNMVGAYCLPNATKLGKGYESEIINLLLLEEVFNKTNVNIELLADPHTIFYYSGARKQKQGSFLDHRYVSSYFYIDMQENGRVAGMLILLFDRSVILIKQKLAKQARLKAEEEHGLAQSQLSVRLKKSQSNSYVEKLKKYEGIYEGSPRYDEKVIQRLFIDMDADNDGFVGREDLWQYCKAKKILISREVILF
jgi:hypothetical protein